MFIHSATHGSSFGRFCNTAGSTSDFSERYLSAMKKTWENWHARAKEAKSTGAKRRPDVEIAEAVSALLEADGKTPVKRAVVNHWFNGKRDPSLSEFFALCEVINADPKAILFLGFPEKTSEHSQQSELDKRRATKLPALIAEILLTAQEMSRDGQLVLLGRAKELADKYPAISQKQAK